MITARLQMIFDVAFKNKDGFAFHTKIDSVELFSRSSHNMGLGQS
jgi:hypothetical protein